MAVSSPTQQRINFRVDSSKKQTIERAAAIKGLSLTDFAVTTLVREADHILRQQEVLTLSDRDRDAFLHALQRPPKPSGRLLRAAAAYRKAQAHGRLR
jgi:uncharacterized protein (DUF1778 family)